MKFSRLEEGHWPTEQQELLLRAALMRGEEAIQAWEHWIATIDIDQVDPGSYRLLPLLYRNLHAQGIDHPLMRKFRGVHHRTWYENQILFHNMTHVLRCFREAGIRTMILKGAPLALLHYKDLGLRSMLDFDVLVPTEQASAAIRLVKELNWTPRFLSPNETTEMIRATRHCHAFRDAAGCEFDLHWNVLYGCRGANADDDFWRGAIAINMGDEPVWTMNSTDLLLHVCAHGASLYPPPAPCWIADAAVILNTAPEIDWHRFVREVRKRCLVLPVRDMLHYLHEELKAPVPLAVLNMSVPGAERMDQIAQTRPEDLRGPVLSFWLRYADFSRLDYNARFARRLLGFLRFLQSLWSVDHLWQVPASAALKGMQKTWKATALRGVRLRRMRPRK